MGPGVESRHAAQLVALEDALLAAIAQARRDADDVGAPAPPKVLHPYLRFARVVTPALDAARRAIELDEAFRFRVLAAVSDDAGMTPAARAFLDRAEGWEEVIEAATLAAGVETAERAASAEADRLRGELAETRAKLEATSTEVNRLQSDLAGLTRDVAAFRGLADAAELARDQAVADVQRSQAERQRAVRELSAERVRSAARLNDLRTAHERIEVLTARLSAGEPLEDGPDVESPAQDGAGGAPVADVARALAMLAGLRSDLEQLTTVLDPSAGVGVAVSVDPLGPTSLAEPGGPATPRQTRRQPVRLTRGVVEDSLDGARCLLGHPGALVIVDGWNVSQQRWPHLPAAHQRAALLDALTAFALGGAAEIRVVLDGVDDGSGIRPWRGGPVMVEFTADTVEADDRILALVETTPARRPVVVVSDDNRVRAGAEAGGANTLRAGLLAGVIAP